MKFLKIENGHISDEAILSLIANAITKIDGVSNRHGVFIDEFIHSVSGNDLNKGIKVSFDGNEIEEVSVYIDVESESKIEKVINRVISQINSDLKVFATIEPKIVNVHVLEVK